MKTGALARGSVCAKKRADRGSARRQRERADVGVAVEDDDG
jgi:hypothetical protein